MERRSFTLIELVTVVIIIGILAGLGVIGQLKAVERARFKQAFNILRMLRDSQQAYKLRNNSFLTCVSIDDCWTQMGLTTGINLDEALWSLSATNVNPERAMITRNGGTYGGCQYSIYLNANDAIWQSAGTCP